MGVSVGVGLRIDVGMAEAVAVGCPAGGEEALGNGVALNSVMGAGASWQLESDSNATPSSIIAGRVLKKLKRRSCSIVLQNVGEDGILL
jgi:hypothetical protein